MAEDKSDEGKPLSFEEGVQRREAAKKAKPKTLAPDRLRLKRPDEYTDQERREDDERTARAREIVAGGHARDEFVLTLREVARLDPSLANDLFTVLEQIIRE
jgi:hypothetical protein